MRKLCWLTAAAAAFSMLAATPASAKHAWGKYHWARTANPFTLQVVENTDGTKWDDSYDASLVAWTGTRPLDLTTRGGSAAANQTCDPGRGIVHVCAHPYGENGWLGLAQIWLTSGNHIIQGTAKMNDTYFTRAAYDTTAWRDHVMCQEIGHTFGLGHQSERSHIDMHTCMDYYRSPHGHFLNQHDHDQLEKIYAHLDGSTTVAAQSTSSAARPYKVTRHDTRRHSEVVEHFADGSRRVTDILWASGGGSAGRGHGHTHAH